MNNKLMKSSSMPNQQGAALIAVLLVLIIIIMIGVVAVKRSSTDLKSATADQMSTVLLQSSESANQKLENIVNGNRTPIYSNLVEKKIGAFGYFTTGRANNYNRGDEFVFCHSNRTNYLMGLATVFRGGGSMGGDSGFCQVNGGDYTYTTDRGTVATQVSIVLPESKDNTDEDTRGFAHKVNPEGKSIQKSYKFDIYATSVIPSYGNPDGCFANSSVPDGRNPSPLMDCLSRSNSPYKVIYQQALVAEETKLSNR
ncbi:MAG: pilus assembly protein PilX [Moraxella equi]|nr:pilus assembly protein PilX [Moraxella equi]